jgi:eukaryotic-like serine/threonine-protein kinase
LTNVLIINLFSTQEKNNVFTFLTKRPLWVNILSVIILTGLLVILFFSSLNFITKHGQYEIVPSVIGKDADAARKILEAKGFEVEILDSIYVDTIPKLAVIKQTPEGEATVKVNRTIYLTINRAQPPLIDMPNLVGFSIRNAEMYLQNLGLNLGDTTFRPDIAKNAVLEQLYNGRPIAPGTKIFMGSSISFVLGDGIGTTELSVPNLMGKQFSEVESLLRSMGINYTPAFDLDVRDSANAYVYKQKPDVYTEMIPGQKVFNRIRPGQSIDLWLSSRQMVSLDSTGNIIISDGQ